WRASWWSWRSRRRTAWSAGRSLQKVAGALRRKGGGGGTISRRRVFGSGGAGPGYRAWGCRRAARLGGGSGGERVPAPRRRRRRARPAGGRQLAHCVGELRGDEWRRLAGLHGPPGGAHSGEGAPGAGPVPDPSRLEDPVRSERQGLEVERRRSRMDVGGSTE